MVDTASIDSLLAATLRAARTGDATEWLESYSDELGLSEAQRAVWERIEFHGIAVLLHTNNELLSGWPAKLCERIAEEARLLGLWEATHQAAVAKLVKTLGAAGVESTIMKGTAIAYSLYDDPSARRRGDSDLLIRPADLDTARSLLAEGGWRRNDDPHGLDFQEGWLIDAAGGFTHALDLHWQPSDRPALQSVLILEDFFTHAQELPNLTPGARRADHALTIVHEMLNQKWHFSHGYWTDHGRVSGARRLIWSVDFNLLVNAMDDEGWARLEAICRERGVGPLVAQALREASSDLDTALPPDALGRLEALPIDPAVASYFEVRDKIGEFWFDLRTAHSWRDRLRILRNRGFPPRKHLVEKYPELASWPTVVLQGRRLVEGAGRLIKRSART